MTLRDDIKVMIKYQERKNDNGHMIFFFFYCVKKYVSIGPDK